MKYDISWFNTVTNFMINACLSYVVPIGISDISVFLIIPHTSFWFSLRYDINISPPGRIGPGADDERRILLVWTCRHKFELLRRLAMSLG